MKQGESYQVRHREEQTIHESNIEVLTFRNGVKQSSMSLL